MDPNPAIPPDAIIVRIAKAIATAEGFYVPRSRPARNHNPGDLTRDLNGRAVGRDGSYVIYANDGDGWNALYKQVRLMFSGSRYYKPNQTLLEIAERYTATERQAWAHNVAATLGVTVETKLQDIR